MYWFIYFKSQSAINIGFAPPYLRSLHQKFDFLVDHCLAQWRGGPKFSTTPSSTALLIGRKFTAARSAVLQISTTLARTAFFLAALSPREFRLATEAGIKITSERRKLFLYRVLLGWETYGSISTRGCRGSFKSNEIYRDRHTRSFNKSLTTNSFS